MSIDTWEGSWATIDWQKESDEIIKKKISYFYRAGVDFNMNRYGDIPLHKAAEYCSGNIIKLLISGGADATKKAWYDKTALHYAISENNISAAKVLCKLTPSIINEKDSDNRTAIYYATEKANKEAIDLLLCFGASVDETYKGGSTLLHELPYGEANMSTYSQITKRLIDHGIDVNAKDSYGQTALYNAIYKKNLDMVKVLIENKSDLNVRDKDDITPLMYTTARGYDAIAKILIEHGADPFVKNKDGKTAWSVAENNKCEEVVLGAKKIRDNYLKKTQPIVKIAANCQQLATVATNCMAQKKFFWSKLFDRQNG